MSKPFEYRDITNYLLQLITMVSMIYDNIYKILEHNQKLYEKHEVYENIIDMIQTRENTDGIKMNRTI